MADVKHNKIKLRELNRHLVCRLCRGYYVDATTIAECLHSFCRSCIIKYLEKNSFCPICEVQIHKTKPYLNLRLDKALQDVVYKLVPKLYHDEMKRRRDFYSKNKDQIPGATPEQCGVEERIIFSPEDSISLSLEYLESDDYETETGSSQSSESGDNVDGMTFPQQLGLVKLINGDGKSSRRESQDIPESSSFPKRYLQCPAVVNVAHLKKFIKMKHDLPDKTKVDIIHKRVPLPNHYTLMDVAYIFTWKRSAPMRFFYQIYQMKKHRVKLAPAIPETDEIKSRSKCEKRLNEQIDEKVENSDARKSIEEVNKNVKLRDLKDEVPMLCLSSADKLRNNNKSVVDSITKEKTEKSESVDSGKKENQDGSVCEKKTVENEKVTNKDSKKDRTDSNPDTSVSVKVPEKETVENEENKSVKHNEYKTLEHSENKIVENGESKTVTVENDVNSNELRNDKCKDQERLLLNPISGQLEPVPSTNESNELKTKTVTPEEKVDNVEKIKEKEKTESIEKTPCTESLKKVQDEVEKDAKKSNVNLLKSFRKEKTSSGKEQKVEVKNSSGNTLTITAVSKIEKPIEKDSTKAFVEIKADNKVSEYDFDSRSSPSKIMPLQEFSKHSKSYMSDHKEKWLGKQSKNSWMSLQDFRLQMLKENSSSEESPRKYKRKSVPSLYRIGEDGNKKPGRKPLNGKSGNNKPRGKRTPLPTIINIQTENKDNSKTEIKIEVPKEEVNVPTQPIKIENKDGEYSVKQIGNESLKKSNECDAKFLNTAKKEESKVKVDGSVTIDFSKELIKKPLDDNFEKDVVKKSKLDSEEASKNYFGAIDLTKTESSTKTLKNPLENLMDLASKSGTPKSDEKMVEALISVAQKQSVEPLLKVPQYSQNSKNSQVSPPAGKNISPNDISQALQFFKDLRSDLKILEAKSQLSPNSLLEQLFQKSSNLEPIQLYQQQIDLIRRLKRQQMSSNDADTPLRKQPKLSSKTPEPPKKLSPVSDSKLSEAAQLKSSVERTLSQIQEQIELQNRLAAAQNYKNLPALLQYYNRSPSFSPSPTSSPPKSNQHKPKPSSHSLNSQSSPNSRKSPQSVTSSSGSLMMPITTSDSSFFNTQNYSHFINAGLNSEMTFHQMFQNYLSQQEKLNQMKHLPPLVKKTGLPPPKSIDLCYGPKSSVNKQEPNGVPKAQKT